MRSAWYSTHNKSVEIENFWIIFTFWNLSHCECFFYLVRGNYGDGGAAIKRKYSFYCFIAPKKNRWANQVKVCVCVFWKETALVSVRRSLPKFELILELFLKRERKENWKCFPSGHVTFDDRYGVNAIQHGMPSVPSLWHSIKQQQRKRFQHLEKCWKRTMAMKPPYLHSIFEIIKFLV